MGPFDPPVVILLLFIALVLVGMVAIGSPVDDG